MRRSIGLVLASFLLTLFAAANAEGADLVFGDPPDVCRAPISTCGEIPTDDPTTRHFRICPLGYTCTCIPSCPNCDDCDAEVCLPSAPEPECETACDCPTGLACIEGTCIAGFAPVYCCEGDVCPIGNQCQSETGGYGICESDRCEQLPITWSCDLPGGTCSGDRRCACTASCPDCEDCGPPTCVPEHQPNPYRCDDGGGCANPGDVCVCKSSCPLCSDCSEQVCVPAPLCEDPACAELRQKARQRIEFFVERSRFCEEDLDCVRVDTSTRCEASAGELVNRRRERWMERVMHRIDRRACSEAEALGCNPGIAVRNFSVPRCLDRRCVEAPAIIPFPVPIPLPGLPDPSSSSTVPQPGGWIRAIPPHPLP